MNNTLSALIDTMAANGLEIDEPWLDAGSLFVPCKSEGYNWLVAEFVTAGRGPKNWYWAGDDLRPDWLYRGWNAQPKNEAYQALIDYATRMINK